jgi:tol-pal system protein YbgF
VDTLSKLVLRLDELQRDVQQMRGEMEEQRHAMELLKKRQRDLYSDIDQRLSKLTGTPPGQFVPPAPQPPAAGESAAPGATQQPPGEPAAASAGTATPPTAATPPAAAVPPGPASAEKQKEEYQAAFNLLMQRRHPEARTAFNSFLERHPGGDLADNAHYWLAESYLATGDYDTALEGFNKVIDGYPDSSKVPDALYKKGDIYYEKKDWESARKVLEGVTREYPSSAASQLAKKLLDRMRGEGH